MNQHTPPLTLHVRFRPRRHADGDIVLAAGATVADLLASCGEPAQATVVVRGGVPITEAEPLLDGEELLVLSAASGG
jgi:sulfur carrier protein ThiS